MDTTHVRSESESEADTLTASPARGRPGSADDEQLADTQAGGRLNDAVVGLKLVPKRTDKTEAKSELKAPDCPLPKLPRRKGDADFSTKVAAERRKVVQDATGVELSHVGQFSIPAESAKGNIEGFSGCVQVPLGFAGPILIHGENTKPEGEYLYIPMATSEGTLVASFSRGMRLTRLAGGIKTTVLDDQMQRAPCFVFEDARRARGFGEWVTKNFQGIKDKAEETTRSGKLKEIEQYAVSKIRWPRFDYETGDAAGQNMVSKATRTACSWILSQNPPGLEHFTLAAAMDTDKKHSHLNTLHTRGKRVVAECTIPRAAFEEVMHTTAETMYYQRQLSNLGTILSQATSNGSHIANGVAAMFIACGQDAANVAESQSGYQFSEILPNGDYYYSVTLTSLIVATYGGGTSLPCQKECLSMLDCYGKGKARRFAEIVAAVALCGELSLGSAVVADEWVSSHDEYGRNRK